MFTFPEETKLYYISCVVEDTLERENNLTFVYLNDIVVHRFDEEAPACSTVALGVVPRLMASALTKSVPHLPLSLTGERVNLLLDSNGTTHRVVTVFSFENDYQNLISLFETFKADVNNNKNVRRVSNNIGSIIRKLITALTTYKICSEEWTRNELLSSVSAIEDEWRQLIQDNQGLTSSDDGISSMSRAEVVEVLEQADTERTGLRDYYIQNISDQDFLHVLIRGSIDKSRRDCNGNSVQIIIKDVEIRTYDPDNTWDESAVVDKVTHLCSFVDESVAEQLLESDQQTFLGRVTPYLRSERSVSIHGSSVADVSVRLIKFAPASNWIDSAHEAINNFESHLKEFGLAGAAKPHKKVRNVLNLIKSDVVNVNPDEMTLTEFDKAKTLILYRYQETKDFQQSLIDDYNAERRLQDRLFHLNLEAFSFLREHPEVICSSN